MSTTRSKAAPGGLAAFWARAEQRANARQQTLPGIAEASLLLALALRRTVRPKLSWAAGRVSRLAVGLGLLLVIRQYFFTNSTLPVRPRSLGAADGWWLWYDQQKTLQAVMAFHRHSLDVADQWYQPLYPLLGALALPFTPRQPFLWPDLIGFAATFLLFVPLARLMGAGRLTAVLVFLVIELGERTIANNWVIPWNTTLTTPLILLGLLSAAKIVRGLRFELSNRVSAGYSLVWPFWFGAAVGLIPAFRPTDLLTLLPASLVLLFLSLRRLRRRLDLLARTATMTAAGFAAGFGIFLASYLPIFGLHESQYMVMSSLTGFDWRLLPLHWVTLVIGPRPLFPGQAGLIEGFWWLVPCFAGVMAVAVAGLIRVPFPEGRRVHVIVLCAILPYWALYLSYRDLHPPGLWKYNNFHYFMWTFPLLGIYGVRLLRLARDSISNGWRSGARTGVQTAVPVGAGVVLTILAVCWRPQLGPWQPALPAPRLDVAHQEVIVPGGFSNIRDALVLSVQDSASRIDFGEHRLVEGGQTFATFHAFRAFPLPGGAMVMPLRALPHADGILRFDGVGLDPTIPPRMLRQDTVFGLPCWVPRFMRPAVCASLSPLPGPLFPPGRQIDFNSKMENAFLIPGGWTDHADGRWTLGYTSSLQFRVPDRPAIGGGVVVEVEGAGFVPRGADDLAIDVSANGHKLTRWMVSTTREVALRVSVPASIIPPDGELMLTLSALNARRPIDTLAHSGDRRLLGFRVRAIRLRPWSEHQDEASEAP